MLQVEHRLSSQIWFNNMGYQRPLFSLFRNLATDNNNFPDNISYLGLQSKALMAVYLKINALLAVGDLAGYTLTVVEVFTEEEILYFTKIIAVLKGGQKINSLLKSCSIEGH